MRGEEPFADRPVPDSQCCGDLPKAVAFRLQYQNPFTVYPALRATELLAIRSRIPNPGTHPLPYQIALKLRHRLHDCEECLPQRAARVDVLLIGNKLDAQRPKFFQRREKVFGGAGEPIKAPHHDRVELPLAGVVHQFIKLRA